MSMTTVVSCALVAGIDLHNGKIDNNQYESLPGGQKEALAASNVDESMNVSAYAENSFYFLPSVAFIADIQFQH
jgi:iron complex outermembrane receptor protein